MAINVLLALMIIGAFLLALPLHEYAHAQVATWLGDPTPRGEGRQALGLSSHLDALGLLLCIILAFFPIAAGPVGLGWGQPVKVDPWKLRGGRNAGPIMVAVAGLLFSLVVGLLAGVLGNLLFQILPQNPIVERIPQLVLVFATVNIALAFFNLLPIYPLDGYQIVYMLLPSRQALQFAKSGRFGPIIILVLFFLLPFIAQFSGVGGFFLFHIPGLILDGALALIGLLTRSIDYISLYVL
ncbi:MAG: site-2 protease family protein [Ktedonobacteraceae bacterium]|nr:site-2 protease family protein [Ktedonobacteraceae bacterium]